MGVPAVMPLSTEVVKIGKSVFMFNLRYDGESKEQSAGNVHSFASKKSLVEEHIIVRTANRHWCAGVRVPRQASESSSRNSATKAGRNFLEMPYPDRIRVTVNDAMQLFN
jgi:hypothetical protein